MPKLGDMHIPLIECSGGMFCEVEGVFTELEGVH